MAAKMAVEIFYSFKSTDLNDFTVIIYVFEFEVSTWVQYRFLILLLWEIILQGSFLYYMHLKNKWCFLKLATLLCEAGHLFSHAFSIFMHSFGEA